jgi:hypothetical protein
MQNLARKCAIIGLNTKNAWGLMRATSFGPFGTGTPDKPN